MPAIARVQSTFPISWTAAPAHRLFDARADLMGPYYVTFGDPADGMIFDDEGVLLTRGVRQPVDILQFGLEQHALWRRAGDEVARERFLAQAQWAATAQDAAGGVRGSYPFPFAAKEYGCAPGYRSAAAQGEAISLLLRAHEETGNDLYFDRAAEASVPLTVDAREGGVAWIEGEDVFFEQMAGEFPSHILSGWIYALWGLFELSRTPQFRYLDELWSQSLETLEKYLPCYDTGTWSYYSLLAAPSGFRRFATFKHHRFHIAQLNVLLSMTQNDLVALVAERWRGYLASVGSRVTVLTNAMAAVPDELLRGALSIPGGARSVV